MKQKEKEKKKPEREFPASLHILLNAYRPAADRVTATHFFSTEEISEAIERHTGEYIQSYEIVRELKQMGFHYEERGELRLCWLLQKPE